MTTKAKQLIDKHIDMLNNKQNFLNLVEKDVNKYLQRNKERVLNRSEIRKRQEISLNLLMKIDELKISKHALSTSLNISLEELEDVLNCKKVLTKDFENKVKQFLKSKDVEY